MEDEHDVPADFLFDDDGSPNQKFTYPSWAADSQDDSSGNCYDCEA